ncbi:hypothetical protein FB451DRAFT_1213021 [Mycena latifolia]|nr:hypothetical protein FB451DRAFT_1213021 [Mycena latifolia]
MMTFSLLLLSCSRPMSPSAPVAPLCPLREGSSSDSRCSAASNSLLDPGIKAVVLRIIRSIWATSAPRRHVRALNLVAASYMNAECASLER